MPSNQPVPSSGEAGVNLPDGLIFPSLVRAAATYTSQEFHNANWRGVRLYINRTVATGTVTVSVQGRDPVTDTWFPIGTTVALTSAIATFLTIYPGVAAVVGDGITSTSVDTPLPVSWRVVAVTATDTTTWSIGGEYLL